VGWGMAGICPGPGMVLFVAGYPKIVLAFTPAMMLAMTLHTVWVAPPGPGPHPLTVSKGPAPSPPESPHPRPPPEPLSATTLAGIVPTKPETASSLLGSATAEPMDWTI
jgi:hypothetical protein